MDLGRKLEILADAAKYDASCASSGANRRNSLSGKGVGSAGGTGICHSYAPDGRCISLLKILMTNACIYDCHYCINRRSSNVERAKMSPEEVISLTLDFYKRNYIEGLFLSSGIIRDADYTMAMVVRVARELREIHDFRGYIHLKTIPEASQELIEEAGKYADRISINIELPAEESLRILAPEKNLQRTQQAMGGIRTRIENEKAEAQDRRKRKIKSTKQFATGQSTQMIVGADDSNDSTMLERSDLLYRGYHLKRVYYSAFSPIPASSSILPSKAPPLIREHRLYQADWLMRFYEFDVEELTPTEGIDAGNLDLDIDPKLAWALRNREKFPVDIHTAPREQLLRIPGLGVRNTDRIIQARRWSTLRLNDLVKLRVNLKKCLPFIITPDHNPIKLGLDCERLRSRFAPPPEQLEFEFMETKSSAITGEV
ncbi:MAG: putative DNA modification/repair radical SAM protein [Verrucomicrobiales bacterium]|nr:putative DNA modification/repair radical SAM protein [Verrucomicrobiales bacterium]